MTALTNHQLASERQYLFGIAYRMLGSASDAEDVVQEALVRAAAMDDVRTPRAYLTTVVTRLCLDELGRARRRREHYLGPHLPEPVPTDDFDIADLEQRENVTLALLMVLDELSPLERAVFVLRDVFDLEFDEVAATLGRSAVACRKLLSRARARMQEVRRAPAAASAQQLAVAQAFFGAIASGNLDALLPMLTQDVTLTTDHGGKASAARRVLHGPDRVSRFVVGLFQKGQRDPMAYEALPMLLNGAPGLVLRTPEGGVFATFTLEISADADVARVRCVRVVRNPDKLRAIARALAAGRTLAVRPHSAAASGA